MISIPPGNIFTVRSYFDYLLSRHSEFLKWRPFKEFDGDFIESQAFAYLAIRAILSLPISFPSTTGCNSPCSGGEIVET